MTIAPHEFDTVLSDGTKTLTHQGRYGGGIDRLNQTFSTTGGNRHLLPDHMTAGTLSTYGKKPKKGNPAKRKKKKPKVKARYLNMDNYKSRFDLKMKNHNTDGFVSNLGPSGTHLYEELHDILGSKSKRKRQLAQKKIELYKKEFQEKIDKKIKWPPE